VHWTDEILDEVRRNLVETGRSTEAQAQRLVQEMKTHFPEATVQGYSRLVASMTNDPKDRHVLAAAVRSQSQVIVTQNLRDFPDKALAPFSIEAQSPDLFLTYLFGLAPETMTQIVIEQAADLRKPPMSVERVLDALNRQVPEFAALVGAAARDR